jgi:hypothetical protein
VRRPSAAGCFVDTQRPITPAETAAWRFFLNLHRDHWRGARVAFRQVHIGMAPSEAMLGFVADTGMADPAILAGLEAVLRDLAAEVRT